MTCSAQGRVTAVLGPTNTGKTYLAVERMLGHRSGMIGFPLRLLARENYDRAVQLKGARQVALVTGEEKIVPPNARYFLCTVESMPTDRPVAFLAVDEVQLCADPERGHVFTDRLLHARGGEETMFLGADTMRPVLRNLVPEAETLSRPRFSTLTYTGTKKLTRLAPRSAVVAFSAAEVYAMAELMRRQRGGTAVVLGALSPRTRNAQVGMFEAGEVDYLVATDAIGMGLNLNLDHVAFAKLAKFDGQATRALSPAELAQIAGRAGRHMADGTFGTASEVGPLPPDLVDAVENHRFDPIRAVYWRNRNLDFGAPRDLLKSLERRPPAPELIRVRETDDILALSALARDPAIEGLASHPAAVRLLWEVCQIPDYRKILSDQHTRLLSRIYRSLIEGDGRLAEDWVAREIDRIDHAGGDIDALTARIARIRTWTYITSRGDWLVDNNHWQERAREIEDKLSDALHDRLTQRFVDRRAAMLVRRLRAGDDLLAAVQPSGDVLVEGEFVGRLEGFRFRVDSSVAGDAAKPLLSAARRALAGEIPARLKRLERDADDAFALGDEGDITWRGVPVARLGPGVSALKPAVEPLPSDFLDRPPRERLRRHLAAWLERHLNARLEPLFRIVEAEADGAALSGPGRGMLFQLVEALGLLPRAAVARQIRDLTRADRKTLAALGLRLGRESIFLPALVKTRSARLRALLWAVHGKAPLPPLPSLDAVAFAPGDGADEGLCHAAGFRRLAGKDGAAVAVRADALERLSHEAQKLSKQGAFIATPRLKRLTGCGEAELEIVLGALRYQVQRDAAGLSFAPRPARKNGGTGARKARAAGRRKRAAGRARAAESPFAKLRELDPGK
ncbi:MAG: helicase-related protein [Kiloniellaceae bacterium]